MVSFEIHPPSGSVIPVGTPAVSPDGTTIAYVVKDSDGASRIHLRRLDQIETRVLPGTEGAMHPFWSPDGQSLAFAMNNMLKRIDLAGGPARDIAGITGNWHGAWSGTGEILGLSLGGLLRTPAQGGAAKQVEGSGQDTFPAFLSDGKRFLVRSFTEKGSAIQLATIGAKDRTLVADNILSAPIFAPTPNGKSYLLFMRDANLMAQEFDEARGSVVGEPVVLVHRIGRVANPAVMPAVGVSRSGVLAYQSADEAPLGQMMWLDRTGRTISTLPPELSVINPSLSPDDSAIVGERPTGGRDVWVIDLKRSSPIRITFDQTLDTSGAWSPDGKRVALRSAEKGIFCSRCKRSRESGTVPADGREPDILVARWKVSVV
jgi:Tol biopolymer transport system component